MKNFRMPTAYTILLLLLVLVAAATWIIPAGSYDRAGETPVAGTYHAVEQQPQGAGDVILASSIWHWGKFYQRIIQTILNGNWNRTSSTVMGESINYWWGISSGMIDMIASKSLPERTMKLVELVKRQIVSGEFQIFSGDLYDQNHVLKNKGNDCLTPEAIIRMDWLLDNIVGHIPDTDSLVKEAIPMVQIQGIYSNRDEG